MNIVVFIENNQNGGLNTFCATLINQWPDPEDSFVVICNKSHPGRKNLEHEIDTPCKFIYHNIPLSWVMSKKVLSFFPSILQRASQPFLRMVFFPIQYFWIRKTLKQNTGDELLVMNGGFPGGESCRIANIAWANMGRKLGVHNFHNFAVSPRFGFGWYENWLDRLLLKSVKSFVSVSHACAASLQVRSSFKDTIQAKCIYNGIKDNSAEENTLNIRDSLNIGDRPLCIMLGNYEPRKGHRFIFEVFREVAKELPEAHLVVCGGGTESQFARVESIKEQLLPEGNIHLLGFVPKGSSLINQADVLLIGSQEFESFGLTAVEAMIRSKPIVSTNTGGLPEVLGSDDSCGYVVDRENMVEFAERTISLLKDKELRQSMGESGRVRAKKLFNADRMVQEYLNIVKK